MIDSHSCLLFNFHSFNTKWNKKYLGPCELWVKCSRQTVLPILSYLRPAQNVRFHIWLLYHSTKYKVWVIGCVKYQSKDAYQGSTFFLFPNEFLHGFILKARQFECAVHCMQKCYICRVVKELDWSQSITILLPCFIQSFLSMDMIIEW